MVQCQFVNIPSWSTAICGTDLSYSNFLFMNYCVSKGLSQYGKCPKGRRCNYLHVFPNPPSKSIEKESNRKHKRSKSRDRSNKKKKHHHHS
jgi:hypothetical protein